MMYRDGGDAVRAELRVQLARRGEELRAMSPACRAIYSRRVGRVAAGVLAGAGGASMLAAAASAGLAGGIGGPVATGGRLTAMLWGSWGVALAGYVIARLWAYARFDVVVRARLAPIGEPFGDLDRARRVGPTDIGVALARRHERASVAAPLVACALLMPLTLHYLVVAGLGVAWPNAVSFDSWVAFSAVLVGHCHAVLALQGWLFARRVNACGDRELVRCAARAGWGAWAWAVGLSSIPGVCFYSMPVWIVAVTGVFIPVSFATLGAAVAGERGRLTSLAGM